MKYLVKYILTSRKQLYTLPTIKVTILASLFRAGGCDTNWHPFYRRRTLRVRPIFLYACFLGALVGCTANRANEDSPPSQPAQGTTSSGGGGNGAVAEIRQIARSIFERLDRRSITRVHGISVQEMRETWAKARVETTERALTLGEVQLDAISYPDERRSVFNDWRWARRGNLEKRLLVIHEILVLHRVSEPLFEVSIRLLERLSSQFHQVHGFRFEGELADKIARKVRWDDSEREWHRESMERTSIRTELLVLHGDNGPLLKCHLTPTVATTSCDLFAPAEILVDSNSLLVALDAANRILWQRLFIDESNSYRDGPIEGISVKHSHWILTFSLNENGV